MGWRAFEVRAGGHFTQRLRLDLVHYNEGKPQNNHRDGFALQTMFTTPVAKSVRFEAGLGPYLSFNTTTNGSGEQKNVQRLGVLISMALRFSLGFLTPGLHLRLGYNYADVIDGHSSHAILFGLGFAVQERPDSKQGLAQHPTQVSIMGSMYRTNRGGTSGSFGGQVEVKQYITDHLAFSASWLREGEDALVDRQGLALQAWFVLPITERWAFSVGAGPYIAHNKQVTNDYEFNGVISTQIECRAYRGTSFFGRLGRLVTRDDTDRDVVELGIGYSW